MRFIQTARTGGDETAPFDVIDYKAKTAFDFVVEVLQTCTKDWGEFHVKGYGWRVEYKRGKSAPIPSDWQYIEIESIVAAGGWSLMDYYITPKRNEKGEIEYNSLTP